MKIIKIGGVGGGLRLGHIAHAAARVADCHPRLQVVDQVCDEGDEDEEDQDNEEDDDVALHFGGGVELARRCCNVKLWWCAAGKMLGGWYGMERGWLLYVEVSTCLLIKASSLL